MREVYESFLMAKDGVRSTFAFGRKIGVLKIRYILLAALLMYWYNLPNSWLASQVHGAAWFLSYAASPQGMEDLHRGLAWRTRQVEELDAYFRKCGLDGSACK